MDMLDLERGRRVEIERWLESRGVEWEHVVDFPVDKFDIEASLNNQARITTRVVEGTAQQYADDMAGGDEFPSVVAYRQPASKGGRLVTVDGNHRLIGAQRAGVPLTVYIIRGKMSVIAAMTIEANAKHGLPLSYDEKLAKAVQLADQQVPIKDIAARLSLPDKDVRKAVLGQRADDRALKQAGILATDWDRIPQSAKPRLMNITTNSGLREAVKLAKDAHLGTDEIFNLVSGMADLADSDVQVDYVKHLRKTREMRDKIQGSAGGAIGPKPGRRVRTGRLLFEQVAGKVVDLPPTAQIIEHVQPAEREELAEQARAAARRLLEVADALEA
jgi:hypothetical protein